jgi:hypothetical protein
VRGRLQAIPVRTAQIGAYFAGLATAVEPGHDEVKRFGGVNTSGGNGMLRPVR